MMIIMTTMTKTTNLTDNLTSLTNLTEGEEDMQKPGPLISLMVPLLMFSAGVLGNVLALLLLWRSRREHAKSVFYRLVAALALTDLVGTTALSPVTLITYSNDLQWVGGQPVCHYFSFMMIFAGLATVLLVLCMAVERCLAILSPYFYERHVAPERVKVLLAAVWTVAASISSLPLVSVGHNVQHYPGTWCFFDFLSDRTVDKVFSIGYAVIGLTVIAATAICNMAVMMVLLRMRRVSQTIGKSREGRTLTNMTSEMQMIFFLAGIILVFATCYCPIMVRVIINVSKTLPVNVEADLMAIRLASLNQILDPWVYLLLRRRLVALLYSSCRSVSALNTMSSLKAIRSEFFSNSPRNFPATPKRPRSLLSWFAAEKHGSQASLGHRSNASLALKRDSPIGDGKHMEYMPLKAKSPQERNLAVGLAKEQAGFTVPDGDSPSDASSSDKESRTNSIMKVDCNSQCTLEKTMPKGDGNIDALLLDVNCVDGPLPLGASKCENKDQLPSDPVISLDTGGGFSSVRKERPLQSIADVLFEKEKLSGQCTVYDTSMNINSKTSQSETGLEISDHLSTTDVYANTHARQTVHPICKNITVLPNRPFSEAAVSTYAESTVRTDALMSSSASWPIVCCHGQQILVKMEGDGGHGRQGPAWTKRSSSMEPACQQCLQSTEDPSYV